MRIAVLGTGHVGESIGSRLIDLGHEVWMGSRDAKGEKVSAWAGGHDARAHAATFAGAAANGEMVINAVGGAVALDALASAGEEALAGKVLVDISIPLDHSKGFPPGLSPAIDDSMGEQIQRAFPGTRVVKALNTMNADVMVDPSILSAPTTVFIAGDDDAAKKSVTDLLASFGWQRDGIFDLGGIAAARGLEAYVIFWISVRMALGHNHFNIALVR